MNLILYMRNLFNKYIAMRCSFAILFAIVNDDSVTGEGVEMGVGLKRSFLWKYFLNVVARGVPCARVWQVGGQNQKWPKSKFIEL